MPIMKYRVLDTVDHDGQRYERGDRLELDEKQALPLVRAGAITLGLVDEDLTVTGVTPKPRKKDKDAPAKDPAPAPDAATDGGDAQSGGTGDENASGAKE